MVSPSQPSVGKPAPSAEARLQQRHSIAALVYFLYGLFYLWGAQYLTNMQMTSRGMNNSWAFFVVGGILLVLLPWLVYWRFAIALSLHWQAGVQRSTLFINFTLLLGIMVVVRVIALVYSGAYTRTWVHTTALVLAAVNAGCLLWASLSQPVWITRTAQGSEA
jgi:hypothetical protein